MRMRQHLLFLPIATLLISCAAETAERQVADSKEEVVEWVDYLFVQHASSVSLQDGLLTLEGIGDDVLYFSDRPVRIAGRESLEEFLEAWYVGDDSFAKTPPNAVLTVKRMEQLADVAVILRNPVLTDRTLVYEAEVLDGPESGSGDLAALFIDGLLKKAAQREVKQAGRLRDRVSGGVRGFREGGRGGGADRPRGSGRGERRGGDKARQLDRQL